jgi:hypothetical protein
MNFVYGTISASAGETTSWQDAHGNDLVIDRDGELVLAFGICQTRSGAGGSITLEIDGTDVMASGSNILGGSDSVQVATIDFSKRTVTAGDTVKSTSTTRDYVGHLLMLVRAT